jgi:surfactin synthase thioesterase subunit
MMLAINKDLTLVFLPGMDGTGKLFAPLLNQLHDFQCHVISLPQSGAQDYATLTNHVKSQLPKSNFIIIAESFSGPIAARLSQQNIVDLKGIVFVATFLSSPNKILLSLVKYLPIKSLMKLPLADFFIKMLFLGKQVNQSLLEKFKTIVNQVPTNVLKQRMQTMQNLKFQAFTSSVPSMYIQSNQDRLVTKSKVNEFQKCFVQIEIQNINGPHFILQAHPKNTAGIITTLSMKDRTKK